jgi:serine/threonine protein kinase
VYALGCVLYEALAARPPFDGRALKELRLKHIGHDLPPLVQKLASHVPGWMCAWVMHLLAADPEQRPRKAAGRPGSVRTP